MHHNVVCLPFKCKLYISEQKFFVAITINIIKARKDQKTLGGGSSDQFHNPKMDDSLRRRGRAAGGRLVSPVPPPIR